MKHIYLRVIFPVLLFSVMGQAFTPSEGLTETPSFFSNLAGSPTIEDELDFKDAFHLSAKIDLRDATHSNLLSVENGLAAVANCNNSSTSNRLIVTLDATGNASLSVADINNGSVGDSFSIASTTISDLSNISCADLGDHTVTLTVNDSSDSTSSTCDSFITVRAYQTSATVEITIAEGKNEVCQYSTNPETLNFTAKPDGLNGDSATYQWFVNGNLEGSGITFSHNSWTANSDNVSVEMTIAGSCGPTATKNQTIVVNPELPVEFRITGPTEVCSGQDATFSILNNSKINVGNGSLYRWFVGTTEVSSGIDQASYTSNSIPNNSQISLQIESSVKCAVPFPQTSTNTIALSVLENPSITLNDPLDDGQTVCIDTEINPISFAIEGTATGATVTGLPPGLSATSNSDILTISGFATESQAGPYLFTVNTTGGNCTPQASFNGSITILPDATLTLTSNNEIQEVCAGEAIVDIMYDAGGTFSNVSVDGLPTGLTGNLSSGEFTISGASTVTGQHDFTVTALGDCDNFVSTGTISINENLSPAVTITSSDSDSDICDGDSVTFSIVTQTNSGLNPTYQWQINDTNVNNETSSSFTTDALSDDDVVKLIMTSSEDCVISATADSNEIQFNVDPNLTPTVTIEATTATTICPGEVISFSATPTDGGLSPSYQWMVNGNNTGTDSPNFNPNNLSNGDDVSVVLTSNETCLATATAQSNIISVIVNPTLEPSVSITSNKTEICSTNPGLTFEATPANGGTTPIYQWKVNGINSGAPTSNNTFSPASLADGASVTVEMTSDYQCPSPSTVTSDAILIDVYSTAPATPANLFGSFIICPVSTETYTVDADDNVSSYNWSFPSGFTITAGQGTNSVTVNVATNAAEGNVTVTAINPCNSSSYSEFINLGSVTADAGPDQYVCAGTVQVKLAGDVEGVRENKYGNGGGNDWWWSDNPSGGTFTTSGNNASLQTANYNFPPSASAGQTLTLTISTIAPSGQNNCGAGATDSMNIFVLNDPTATVTTKTNGSPICEGSDSGFLISATAFPGLEVTVNYTLNGTAQTANITMDASGNGTADVLLTGLTSDQDIQLNNIQYTNVTACSSPINTNNTASIIVNQLEVAEAGPDIEACSDSAPIAITLSGASVSGGATEGQWTHDGTGTLSSTGFVANPSTVTYTPSSDETGIVNFTLKTNAAGECPSVIDTRELNIFEKVTVGAGSEQTVCSDEIVSLVGSITGGTSSGTWSANRGVFANANNLSTTYTPDASDYGTTITLTLTSADPTGPCNVNSSTVDITIEQKATVDAGNDGDVCSDGSILLGGSSTDASSLLWTASSGSFDDASSPTATYTPGIDSGNVVLRLSAAATPNCSEVFDEITIKIHEEAVVEAGPDITICAGQDATMAAVLDGPEHSGEWSSNGNGTFSNNSASAKYTPSSDDITSGSVELTYTFTPNGNNNPCSVATDNLTLTINPLPTVDLGTEQTICSDAVADIIATLTGANSGTWTSSGNGTFGNSNANSTTYTPGSNDIDTGSATLTFTTENPAGPCEAVSNTLLITVKEIPEIQSQPQNSGVCAGVPATISVVGYGDDLNYQWFKGTAPGGTAVSSSSTISGVTTDELSFSQTAASDAGEYYVVISGNGVCSSITSDSAILDVNEEIVITSQPIDIVECENNTIMFSVTTLGTIDSFQWRKDGSNVSTGTTDMTTDSGETTITLELTNVAPADAGNYDVIINSAGGICSSRTSTPGELTVNELPNVNVGDDITICSSETATVTATISGSITAGVWTSASGNTGGFDNASSLSTTYTPSNTDIANGSIILTFTSNNASTPCIDANDEIIITINEGSTITNLGTDLEICEGDVATLTASYGGGATSGGWSSNGGGSFSGNEYIPAGTDLPTNSPVTIQLTYTATDPDGSGPCSDISESINLTINPESVVDVTPDIEQTICSNQTVSIQASLSGSITAGTWSSSSGNTAGFDDTNALNTIYTPSDGDISNGSVVLTFTSTNAAAPCNDTSDSFVLNINEAPSIADLGSDLEICQGETATLTATFAGGATSGGWATDGNGSFSGNVYTPSGGDIPTDSPNTVILTYTANDPDGAEPCVAVSESINLTIYPQPTVSVTPSSDQTICSDQTINVTASLGGGATGGNWTSSGTGSFNDIASLSAIYTPSSADLSSTADITLTFTTIDPDGPCNGASQSVNYDIDQKPVGGTALVSSQGLDGAIVDKSIAVVCENTPFTINLSGFTGTIQEWQYSMDNGVNWTTVTNNTNSLSASYSGSTRLYRAVLVSSKGVCSPEYSSLVVINVAPKDLKPDPIQVSSREFCLTESSTLSATSSINGGQFEYGGNFQRGQINPPGSGDYTSWLVDGNPGGWTANGDNTDAPHDWSGTNDHPFGNVGTLDSGDKKFAIADGKITTVLETPIFNSFGVEEPKFEFDYAYYLPHPDDRFIVEISIDGGATYLPDPLWLLSGEDGLIQSGNYNPFSVNQFSYNLADYYEEFGVNLIGLDNLRVKFTFIGNDTPNSLVAMDGIGLEDPAVENEIIWTELPTYAKFYNSSIVVTPPVPGIHPYAVTSYIVNQCDYALTDDNTEFVDLSVHYSFAGNTATALKCGNGMSLQAYDNHKTPYENYLAYIGGTYGDRSNSGLPPGVPFLDVNGDGLWDMVDGEILDYDANIPNTEIQGEWKIISGPEFAFTATVEDQAWWQSQDVNNHLENSDASYTGNPKNNPNAVLINNGGGTYVLEWTVKGCSSTIEVNLSDCPLDWNETDGVLDDYVTMRDVFPLNNGPFSIELWVKSKAANGNIQTLVSKRDANNNSKGYDLRLVNNKISFNWFSGSSGSITAAHNISTGRWYHLALTYDGSTYSLYLDGILSISKSGTSPGLTSGTEEFLLGAMDQPSPSVPVNHYYGWMDELRIWNTALSVEQIRQMMNQQIHDNGGAVQGDIVPIDVPGLNWSNLDGYYQMNQQNGGGDVGAGYLYPNFGKGADGKLVNIETIQDETAPLPYYTKANGDWDQVGAGTPWMYGDSVWDHPNSTGINGTPIDWNIVRTAHDVTQDHDEVIVLGLLVDTNELTVTSPGVQDEYNPGHGLYVTHYLLLNGVIDLIGESQLVQKYEGSYANFDSQLDPASSGYLERDQQGQTKLHNYNYFSSPVSTLGGGINAGYTVDDVLHDGTTTASPVKIGWTANHDAGGTPNPIKNSSRWIYKYYNNPENTYLDWEYLAQGGAIEAGIGFTIKGSGVTTKSLQNYTYMGMPNNSNISLGIGVGGQSMVGNPYPSALSIEEFIMDNTPSFGARSTSATDGVIYYWEHFLSNNTHILKDYEGGYAVQTLTGGVSSYIPSSANPTVDGFFISGLGGLTRTPGPYIPVGQGFFVTASEFGGNVEFRNSQRFFERESDGSSLFVRKRETRSVVEKTTTETSPIQRIRLAIGLPEGHVRPLLIGFIDNDNVTDKADYGYDARSNDIEAPDDGFWDIDGEDFVIQGVGKFDKTKKYPLALYSRDGGDFIIQPYEFENFDENPEVYLFDAYENSYTLINDIPKKITLVSDTEIRTRYFIAFQNDNSLEIDEEEFANDILVNYLQDEEIILIKTPDDVNPKQIYLLNLLGQTVRSWNATNLPMTNELRIPIKHVSDGSYIIKLETNIGSTNKKVVIKQ